MADSPAALAGRSLLCPCPLVCPIQRAGGLGTGPALAHLVRSSTATWRSGVKQVFGWRKEAIEGGRGARGSKGTFLKPSGVNAYGPRALTFGVRPKKKVELVSADMVHESTAPPCHPCCHHVTAALTATAVMPVFSVPLFSLGTTACALQGPRVAGALHTIAS